MGAMSQILEEDSLDDVIIPRGAVRTSRESILARISSRLSEPTEAQVRDRTPTCLDGPIEVAKADHAPARSLSQLGPAVGLGGHRDTAGPPAAAGSTEDEPSLEPAKARSRMGLQACGDS